MNNDIVKVIYRKNDDGTMTKVLIRKVKKNIKIKSAKKKVVAPPKGNIEENKSPKRQTETESKASFDSIDGKKSIKSPFIKQTRTQPTRDGVKRGGPPIRGGQRPFDAKSKKGEDSRPNQKFAPSKNDGKILITKKRGDQRAGNKSGQFYQKGAEKTFLEERKNRNYSKNYHRLDEDFNKKDKNEINELAGVPKEIEIQEVVSIKDLALKLNLKASQVIKKVFSLGVVDLTVNDNIDSDSAELVANEFGCKVKVVTVREQTTIELEKGKTEDYVPRAPIVTVMGHVDHGKTSLLDKIRDSKVAEKEEGGITQHIGATKIEVPGGELLFIDTPGHEAFSLMRSRGVKVTDIVVLVVSGVEGVLPQTVESIAHAKASGCPLVVCVTKMDLPDADFEKVRTMLSSHDVVSTDWGGEVPFFPVSSKTGEGIDKLLEGILKLAKEKNYTWNPKIRGYGYVLESELDSGKGAMVTVVITNGVIKKGESYICGKNTGRIRAIFDDSKKEIKSAKASMAVRIIGIAEPIPSGELFQVTVNEKESKRIAEKRSTIEREKAARKIKPITISNLFAAIKESHIKELRLIIKCDTYGSQEAIKNTLETLKNDEIRANIIHSSVGQVNENDVSLALTTKSDIIAFNVRCTGKIKKLCEEKGVKIKLYSIIYEIVEDIKENLSEKLGDEYMEDVKATLKVKDVFKISGVGKVAGCVVEEGTVLSTHKIRVTRDGRTVYTNEIDSLKRFKESASKVEAGNECGLSVKDFQDIKVGDVLEALEVKKVKKKLELNKDEKPIEKEEMKSR